jgi:hypothetical protein
VVAREGRPIIICEKGDEEIKQWTKQVKPFCLFFDGAKISGRICSINGASFQREVRNVESQNHFIYFATFQCDVHYLAVTMKKKRLKMLNSSDLS